jgi:hypothetical protein
MAHVGRKLGILLSEFDAVLMMKFPEGYIMMSKHGTDSEMVKLWCDTARQIKKDGTFQRIAQKWAKNIFEEYGIVWEVKDGALNF